MTLDATNRGMPFTDPGAVVLYNSQPVSSNLVTVLLEERLVSPAIIEYSATGNVSDITTRLRTYSLSVTDQAAVTAAGYSVPKPLQVTRLVSVVDGCSSPEFTCTTSLVCSYQGACDSFSSTVPSATSIATLSPPLISISGTGTNLYKDGSSFGMLTVVAVGSGAYQDAGATSLSAGGVDMSSAVLSCGASRLSTAAPTAPGSGFVITYLVQDAYGNAGNPAYRFVQMACATKETVCVDANSGSNYCSIGGICGVIPKPAYNLRSVYGVQSSAIGRSSTPSLTLEGDSLVTLPYGAPAWDRCDSPVDSDGCDVGATATSAVVGDMDDDIFACLSTAGSYPQPFNEVGLLYCGLNTSVSGRHNISFSLAFGDPTPVSYASVVRTVVILPNCPPGTVSCSDGTCSDGGCEAVTGISSPAMTVHITTSPVITLWTSSQLGSNVQVPYGSAYVNCWELNTPGQAPVLPMHGALCEMGGTVFDADEGNITSKLLLCPPDACLYQGRNCGPHLFSQKPLSACGGINTATAEIGAVLTVQLAVRDATGLRAVAHRIVTIVTPCLTGQTLCSDGCGQVPCASRGALGKLMAALTPTPPSILLLPNATTAASLISHLTAATTTTATTNTTSTANSTLASNAMPVNANASTVWTYNQPPAVSLQPCASLSGPAGCSAVALDGSGVDLSSAIAVEEVTQCAAAVNDVAPCMYCSPYLADAGICLPGVYTYKYTVTSSSSGLSASAWLQVTIQEVLSETVTFTVNTNLTSAASAMDYSAKLLMDTPARSMMLQAVLPIFSIDITNGRFSSASIRDVSVATPAHSFGPLHPIAYPVTVTMNVVTQAVAAQPTPEGSLSRRRMMLESNSAASTPLDAQCSTGSGMNVTAAGLAAMAAAAHSLQTLMSVLLHTTMAPTAALNLEADLDTDASGAAASDTPVDGNYTECLTLRSLAPRYAFSVGVDASPQSRSVSLSS
ncbi:MAG: hypothetical protein WDW38_007790 [Sanguina aurantia]